MNILVIDTETTGLPRDYNAPTTDTANWPRVVQIAWQIYDGEQFIAGENHLIKPNDFEIPAAATAVHGITTKQARRDGISITAALAELGRAAKDTTLIIGHNLSFDTHIIEAEAVRLHQASPFPATAHRVCTMTTATPLMRLPGKYGWKFPRLDELHRYLFGADFDDAHNAQHDVSATARCYFEMVKRGWI